VTRAKKRIPSRERTLQQVVFRMWMELKQHATPQALNKLEADIREAGHAWALPEGGELHPDTLLNATEVAARLGIKASTVRNWPTRYGLQQVNGQYRWGDVQKLIHPNRTDV
jgi:hypothetical protein